MKHYYEEIKGFFNFEDIYFEVVQNANDGDHFVEVGAYLGKSAIYMAVEIINSGKDITLDVIDTWKGSAGHQEGARFQDEDIVKTGTNYPQFLKNIEPVKDIINPKKMLSVEGAKAYEDETLNFVYLDASHDYKSVKDDLDAWHSKLKKDGVFAGHDYLARHGVYPAVQEFCEKYDYVPQKIKRSWLIDLKERGYIKPK